MELSSGTDVFDEWLLPKYDPDNYLKNIRDWWAILPNPPEWLSDFVRSGTVAAGKRRYKREAPTYIRIESGVLPDDGQRVLIKTLRMSAADFKNGDQYKRNFISLTTEAVMGRFLTQHAVSPHYAPFICAYSDHASDRFVCVTAFAEGPLVADYYCDHYLDLSLARFAALQFQTWFTVVATARRLRMVFDDRHGANRVAMSIAADHVFYNRPWAYEVAPDEYVVLTGPAHGNLFVCDFDYDFVQDALEWKDRKLAEAVREVLLQTLHYPNGESKHDKSHFYNLNNLFTEETNPILALALRQQLQWARQPHCLEDLYATWHETMPFLDALQHIYGRDHLPEDVVMMGSVLEEEVTDSMDVS